MTIVPPEIQAVLLDRYMLASTLRAKEQFPWEPHPLVMFWMPVRVEGHYFELMPDGCRPRKADWHWVLAARFGLLAGDRPSDARRQAMWHATMGGLVMDLVACTPDLLRVRARLTGAATVLGYPPDSDMAVEPVRVHATPLSWLRGCAPGVIADSVAHGEALLMKMQRPVPALPRILVAA